MCPGLVQDCFDNVPVLKGYDCLGFCTKLISIYFTPLKFLFQGTSGSVRILAPPKFTLRQDMSGKVTVRKCKQ